MRSIATALLLSALLVIASHTAAAAESPVTEEDRKEFTRRFEADLIKADQTRGKEDDEELLGEMLKRAARSKDAPGLQCLIYAQAIELSASAGDLETMIYAARRLDWLYPDNEAARDSNLTSHARRAYLQAGSSEKITVGEYYIDLLLAASERAESDGKYEIAHEYSTQAVKIGHDIDSTRLDQIAGKHAEVTRTHAQIDRINKLKEVLNRNPRDRYSAIDLMELLVIKRNDPVAAAEFIDLTQDEQAIDAVRTYAAGIQRATPADALRVANWYMRLAQEEDDVDAEPMLNNARQWYAHFLDRYPREDGLAEHIRSRQEVAEARIQRIEQARRQATRGQWADLIAGSFDPKLHSLGEEITVRGGDLTTRQSDFVIPVTPEGSYRLRVRLTIHEGTPGLIVHLPAADTVATIRYAWKNNTVSMIDNTDRFDDERKHMNRVGRETTLVFSVRPRPDGEVQVAMDVNGRASLSWTGLAGELSPTPDYAPPQSMGRIFRFTCPGQMTFHAIELLELED